MAGLCNSYLLFNTFVPYSAIKYLDFEKTAIPISDIIQICFSLKSVVAREIEGLDYETFHLQVLEYLGQLIRCVLLASYCYGQDYLVFLYFLTDFEKGGVLIDSKWLCFYSGYKMTVEPPRGIKANLLKAFMNQVPDFVDYINSGDPKVPNFKVLIDF